jgi:hypothetical protein
MRRRRNFAPPTPKAIDPRTGFKVDLSSLVKDGQTSDLVWDKVADRKHPQEFVRARPERINLPFARPEPPDRGIALNIIWEDGILPIVLENGAALLAEGEVAVL